VEIGLIFKKIPVPPCHHFGVIPLSGSTAVRARKGGSLLKIDVYVETAGLR
jgi:hypothetical protein